jgi:hypothetical protein
MPAIFTPAANTIVRMSLVGLVLFPTLGVAWWWLWPRMDYRLHTDWTVEQPVPFSHQHHVDGLGLDCRFCHTTVETSGNAGMPPTYTCMTCHSQIWTNAAILAPVRDSLANNTPLVWHRINDLPDYVYFNHAIHIAKGVGCAECHGQIDKMPLLHKAHGFTMGFCVDCHANPGPRLRPKDQIFNLSWHRDASTPSPDALMRLYHIGDRRLTDCSICHR